MFMPPPHDVTTNPTGSDPFNGAPNGLAQKVQALFKSKQTPPPDANDPPPADPSADPYDPSVMTDQFLLERFQELKRDASEMRFVFERQWWRTILYLLNRQWIYFDAKRNEWRDKRLKKWIPKPVTNKLKEVQSTVRAMFASVQLGTLSRPNGNDPKNISTANTVDQLQPLIHEEHQMETVMPLADFWFINLGNVFLHPWWNPDGGTIVPINEDQCAQCGPGTQTYPINPQQPFQCPTCGSQQSQQVHVTDVPSGAGSTDVVSPFELLVPSFAATFDEVDRLIRVRWRTKKYYEEHYPDLAPKLTFEQQPQERTLNMFKAIASQNDMATTPYTLGTGNRTQTLGLTEYEYWEKPSSQFPKGLFFRTAGEQQIIHDPDQSMPGPIPTETVKQQTLWPWIHIPYEVFGGKLWSDGVHGPLFQKQDQINQLDSHTELSFQRMGNPVWLEPKGTEVERLTGEPGIVVKYSLIGNTNAKPERIPGEDIRPGVFQLRMQYLTDIEELAGTYDILKGQKPTGVEAFSALQLLVERSQSRFTAAFQARGEAYRKWFAVALELERKYGPKQRTLSLLGPNGTWTFQTFQQADLLGDISIVVEDGTNVPKTALGRRAALEQAFNMGAVNPADPDVRYALLSEMGLSAYMPSLDVAKNAALRMQASFEQWATSGMQGPPPLKIQPWDDPEILLSELRKWANGDTMLQILDSNPIASQLVVQYYTQLATMIQMAQQAQAVAAAGTGAIKTAHPFAPGEPVVGGAPGGGAHPPGHAAGGGQAMSRSNANSTKASISNHGQNAAGNPAASAAAA